MAGARGVYRAFPVGKLDDPAFQALTAQARLLYLALRLSPEAGIASIARLYPDLLRERTGLPAEDVAAALHELEAGQWIEVLSGYAWVRDALRDDPSISLDNVRQRSGIFNQLACLPPAADELVRRFLAAYGLERPEGPSHDGPNGGDPIDSPMIPYQEPIDNLSIQGSVSGTGTATGEGSGAVAEPGRKPATSDAPRRAPLGASAPPEEDPEPGRLARLFADLRRKAAPGAVVPESLIGWTSTFGAILQAGAHPKDVERAMRFGFAEAFWAEKLTDPQALQRHLPTLVTQSAAREGKRAAVQADHEQERRARRAQERRPESEPGQTTPQGTAAGLQGIGEILARMGIPQAREGEK